MRQCYACETTTSTQNYNGKDYQHWIHNKPTNFLLCDPCYQRIIYKPIAVGNRILFKDKRIRLKFNPRTGICSNCGKTSKTNLHHTEYDPSNPLANTTELCCSCHRYEHVSRSSLFSVK